MWFRKCETSTVVPSCCSHTSDCDHKVPNIFGSHLADCVNDQTCGKKIFSRQSKVIGVMETLNNERKECYCEGNFFLSFDSTGEIFGEKGTSISVSFQSNITGSFVQTALKALGELQKKLLERVGMVYMLSGTAVDHNYDVVADLDQKLVCLKEPPIVAAALK